MHFRLSVMNSNINRLNYSKSKSVLIYDENGILKEEIILNNVNGKLTSHDCDGTFIKFNRNLFMTSNDAKILINFSRINVLKG